MYVDLFSSCESALAGVSGIILRGVARSHLVLVKELLAQWFGQAQVVFAGKGW